MRSVLEQLVYWAEKLPRWQQIAFERILSKSELSDEDYQQIFEYFLQESKLTSPHQEIPKPHFPKSNLRVVSQSKPFLVRLFHLQNINALVPNQTLPFDPKLTVIYGANGSGKSGYARLLASAAFTRGDKEVLPDISSPVAQDEQSAELEIDDGRKKQILQIKIGSDPLLDSFYIFDSTSVRAQLTEQNEFSFCPANLDSLTNLCRCIEEMQQRLKAKIEGCNQKSEELFNDDPSVLEEFEAVGCDLAKLDECSQSLQSDEKELKDIDLRIAKLKSENREAEIEELKRDIKDIQGLHLNLRRVQEQLNEKYAAVLNESIVVYTAAVKKSSETSKEDFRSDAFRAIGSNEWNHFIKAGQALATLEKESHLQYPGEKDACLFCHQDLSEKAKELIKRYWDFLDAENEKAVEKSELEINSHINRLRNIDCKFLSEESAIYRSLENENKSILSEIVQFIEEGKRRIAVAVSALTERKAFDWNSYVLMDADLLKLLDALNDRLQNLHKGDAVEEMEALLNRKTTHEKRIVLAKHAAKLKEWTQLDRWISKAEAIKISSRNITSKYNELFEQLVADRYVELFSKNLNELARNLNVKVVTKGKKGSTVKQLALTIPTKVSPDRILSEGEKRAVALADFLTEVMLDENSSGIVLDDPVTSLDCEWKQTIAARIVVEAKQRQVIIFTHDLHFLYLIRSLAKESELQPATHWVKKGNDGRPGYVAADNCPSLEEEYKDARKAREFYTRAVNADNSAEEQEMLLRAGFGALRTSYEAFVLFELFNGVVRRFEERISIERLKDVVIKQNVVQRIIDKVGFLSRYIEGHLHSDQFAYQKPTPKDLLGEIDAFEKLRAQQKELKKDVNRSSQLSLVESEKAAQK